MARITKSFDDLDMAQGEYVEAAESFTFVLETGQSFVLDLSEEHAASLKEEYLNFGNRVEATQLESVTLKPLEVVPPLDEDPEDSTEGSKGTTKTGRPPLPPGHSGLIREWIANEGVIIKERGPVPLDLVISYYETHSGAPDWVQEMVREKAQQDSVDERTPAGQHE